MDISLIAIQLAVIFLPGIFWARLDTSYGSRSRPSDREFALRALLFGLASYATTFVLFAAAGLPFAVVDLNAKTFVTPAIAFEVVCALVVSAVLGLLWLYATNYQILTRPLLKIGATTSYGEGDVWELTFNAPRAPVEYVQLRDFANRIVCTGRVNMFCDSGELRELLLSNARNLARRPDDIHIEFPVSLLR